MAADDGPQQQGDDEHATTTRDTRHGHVQVMRQIAATGADVAALHAFVDGGWTAEAFASSRRMLIDALLAGPSRPAAS